MGWFGGDTLEEYLRVDIESWQESYEATNLQVIKALVKVLEYFTDLEEGE